VQERIKQNKRSRGIIQRTAKPLRRGTQNMFQQFQPPNTDQQKTTERQNYEKPKTMRHKNNVAVLLQLT
jgi:hypothetical protein